MISSIEELERRSQQKITDLHRHFIDEITFVEKGRKYRRIPEVFDCWFESGSMPYAQHHFPFENQEQMQKAFPADFIAEGLDQTRGWFYTLTVLAAALFDKPAFKNVIVNGIILAEDGQKMSKRLKNYPEPQLVINGYGADSIRLYLLSSPAVNAEDLRFSERGVELVMRQVMIPLWNAYVFLATYASIYQWKVTSVTSLHADIDRYLLSLTQKLVQDVEASLDGYELSKAVEPLVKFVDQLTNWYIRRSRARFWADEKTQDREQAFQTLYHCLLTFVKVAAPFIPFLAEQIYQELKQERDEESVHLCDYPVYNGKLRDEKLEEEMHFVQKVVSSGHALRKEHKLKVRQPLQKAHIICRNLSTLDALKRQSTLIADELNVKEIAFLTDETEFVTYHAKPNFRILGKKVGKLMNSVKKVVEELSLPELLELQAGKTLQLNIEGEEIVLTSEEVAVERKVKEGLVADTIEDITVALDTQLTEALLVEGLARELVNKVNTMRRDEGFSVTDRITAQMETTPRVQACYEQFQDYICHECLITELKFVACTGTSWDLNGEPAKIAIALA